MSNDSQPPSDKAKSDLEKVNEYNSLKNEFQNYYNGQCEISETFSNSSKSLVVELISSEIPEDRLSLSASRVSYLTFQKVSNNFDSYTITINEKSFNYDSETLTRIVTSDSLTGEVVALLKEGDYLALKKLFIQENPYNLNLSEFISKLESSEMKLPPITEGYRFIGFDVFPNNDIRIYGLVIREGMITNLTIEFIERQKKQFIALIDYNLLTTG
ncbi:hypothetical protein [Parvicella tangerina]|nr:hypothetical protein [Parvicella tangerina]